MVKAAKKAYENFPTVVNALEESGLKYKNIPEEYAKMDAAMAAAQKAIGGSSDSAQLAQSYYWTRIANNINDEETQELYENIIILAVLAQVAIDGCKKTFSVDANSEIQRIRAMDCMNRSSDGELFSKGNRKDFPLFWVYTHNVPVTKNGKERSSEDIARDRNKLRQRVDSKCVCPMNWVQNCLNKASNMNRLPNSEMKEAVDFYIKIPGRAYGGQMSKIRDMIEEYDNFIRNNRDVFGVDDEMFEILSQRTDAILEYLRTCKISKYTINRLIGSVLGVSEHVSEYKKYKKANKYIMHTLSLLHRANKEAFLSNFEK